MGDAFISPKLNLPSSRLIWYTLWARCRSCSWMHTCLWLDVTHIIVSLNAFTYTSCICSGGVSALGGALGLFSLDVCMCQQGGEFWEKWSNKGGDLFDFWKTCCAHGFESASVWESCTCEREGKTLLGEFLLWFGLLVSLFSLCFLHDCVERYLCLWGVMFWLLIDCVEPLPLS